MPHQYSLQAIAVCMAFASGVAGAVEVPSAKPPNLQMELRLHDAVVFDRTPDENRWPLLLLLRRTDDGWQRAWATARDANHSVHSAALDNVEFTEKFAQRRFACYRVCRRARQPGRLRDVRGAAEA